MSKTRKGIKIAVSRESIERPAGRTIKIDIDLSQKIAEALLSDFFDVELHFQLSAKGILISDADNFDVVAVVPWNMVFPYDRHAIPAVQEWLKLASERVESEDDE